MMNKIAIPDALDTPRNINTLRLLLVGHELRNVAAPGREPAILPEVSALRAGKAFSRTVWLAEANGAKRRVSAIH
jgi:hypothetical protein